MPGAEAATLGRRAQVAVFACVALGGFVGTLARYELTLAWPRAASELPAATLAVNTVGALAIGLVYALLPAGSVRARALLGTGLLGGWTTMSGFAVDTTRLLDEGAPGVAVTYVLVTLAAGLVAVLLGRALGERLDHHEADEVVE